MKRQDKPAASLIISEAKKYSVQSHRPKITQILKDEQSTMCAYTEERINTTVAVDIDHFKPKKQFPDSIDDYNNLYLIVTELNRKKNDDWDRFQPILWPNAIDFNERVLYDNLTHEYYCQEDDIEADNLISFVQLNRPELVKYRQSYISRLHKTCKTPQEVINHIATYPDDFRFRRAVETEFGISL